MVLNKVYRAPYCIVIVITRPEIKRGVIEGCCCCCFLRNANTVTLVNVITPQSVRQRRAGCDDFCNLIRGHPVPEQPVYTGAARYEIQFVS